LSIELITLIMFGGLLVLLLLGLPLAFVMSGIGVVVALIFWDVSSLGIIVASVFGSVWNIIYICIPLFVFMGILLERAGIAEALFESMYYWSGSLRGGLAIGTVGICAIFAAMTASTGPATVTMGLIATPAMLKHRYHKDLALGVVAGAGTLGMLIPPSNLMIMLAVVGQMSVGQLFMAGIFPGLVFASLFIVYIIIRGLLQPQLCPATYVKPTMTQKITSLKSVVLPIIIICSVLGSIFLGIATPTEAASLGATSCLMAVAIQRRLTWQVLKQATIGTFEITSMVMWILIAASIFASVYNALGGFNFIRGLVLGLSVSPIIIILIMMVIVFFLGMVLDPTGILFITAPIFFPIVKELGYPAIWFAIIYLMNMLIGYITPPVGFNLFYLSSVAPQGVTLKDIYRSVWPFVLVMIVGVVLVILFPQIALWLPSVIVRLRG